MKRTDSSAVAALFREVVGNLPYYNAGAKSSEVSKFTSGALQKMLHEDRDSVLVAVAENTIAGFCISRYDDGVIWLAWFGVKETYRCSGIATAMLTALEKTVSRRKAHKIWCDTRTSNLASQLLLRRLGYRRICKLQNHWYSHDFFLWEKAL